MLKTLHHKANMVLASLTNLLNQKKVLEFLLQEQSGQDVSIILPARSVVSQNPGFTLSCLLVEMLMR